MIRALASECCGGTGSTTPIVHVLPAEWACRSTEISPARELLSWEPRAPPEQGIEMIVAWFDELLVARSVE